MHRIFKKEQIMTIPNLLSLIRLLMIPLIVWLYIGLDRYPAAVAVLVASGITDIADGFIARRFHMVSDLGKILDPIADKLTQVALIICLASRYKWMTVLVALFIGKELCMALLGLLTLKQKDSVNGAKWHGKVNTVLLYTVIMVLILFPNIPLGVANGLIFVSGCFMILSFVLYVRFYIHVLKQNDTESIRKGTEKNMNSQKHSGKEKFLRLIVWAAAELFTIACLLYSIWIRDAYQVLACIAYAVLISGPFIIEKWFRCRISTWFVLCCILYAIGPLLGDVFRLYYITTWWDKLLHFIGGLAFGVLGAFLPQILDKKQSSVLLCAAFSLCFSIFVSVCWEFCEYGMDQIAGTDAQHSSVVHEVHSYLLGEETGKIGSIEDIRITTVDGDLLPINGYLDIGLHDTMGDMLFEGLGALIYAVIYIADKGKHAVFSKKSERTPRIEDVEGFVSG